MDFDDETPQGTFHGFLYIVGFQDFVVTDVNSAGTTIDERTFVQTSITIGGTTYTAAANYQAATNDWLLTANLPGNVLINETVGSVNHHFDFVVPVTDGTNVALASATQVGATSSAAGTPDGSGSSASIQLTTSALAWGVATPSGTSPLPGDFNGDGALDGNDYNTWRANFGIEIGAAGPQGDANLDGAVDAADYVVWRKSFDQLGSGNGATVDHLSVPEPSNVTLLLVYPALAMRKRVHRKSRIGDVSQR